MRNVLVAPYKLKKSLAQLSLPTVTQNKITKKTMTYSLKQTTKLL